MSVRDFGMSFSTAFLWFLYGLIIYSLRLQPTETYVISNFVVAITFPPLIGAFTPTGAFAWYAGWNLIGFTAAFFFVPETKGYSLEELDEGTSAHMSSAATRELIAGQCSPYLRANTLGSACGIWAQSHAASLGLSGTARRWSERRRRNMLESFSSPQFRCNFSSCGAVVCVYSWLVVRCVRWLWLSSMNLWTCVFNFINAWDFQFSLPFHCTTCAYSQQSLACHWLSKL